MCHTRRSHCFKIYVARQDNRKGLKMERKKEIRNMSTQGKYPQVLATGRLDNEISVSVKVWTMTNWIRKTSVTWGPVSSQIRWRQFSLGQERWSVTITSTHGLTNGGSQGYHGANGLGKVSGASPKFKWQRAQLTDYGFPFFLRF